MRKLSVMLLAAALLLCAVPLCSDQAEGAPSDTSIVGQVIDVEASGFPGVVIKAVNATTFYEYSTVSAADGNYSLMLNPGLYTVSANFINYTANVTYHNVQVGVGQVVRLNFTMSELLGTLTGYVSNGTVPIYGAKVTLLNDQYNYSGVSVNPLGQYTISNVRPGTYTVITSKVGYYDSAPQAPVTMERNVTKFLDFVLDEQPAELNGRVVYQGDGLAGVKVVIVSNQFTTTAYTDGNGNYSFQLIPAGTYDVTFSKDTYLDHTQNVGLSPFEVETLNVEMEFDSANNTHTYLLDFDLAHSLMIVGLTITLTLLLVALFINHKAKRKPETVEKEEESEK
ncbi:MAG: carboxypeptidase-like regulatory domain-containing protein [Methanomassiliicoccales archaeon]|nr:carboxypeptidase-like regulatory domain-containing protein [Methanomassiliicoccales archaeon]